MKIESVDFFYLSMPVVEDIADGSQDALLVRVRAGNFEGWGECEAAPLPSIAAWICPLSHSACRPVRDSVLGQRLEELADISRISALARGITFVNHTFTSHLALSASLQPFAGLEAHRMCEYPVEAKPLAMELTVERILPDAAGLIRVPEAPGLGMTPNLQVVRQYLVDTEIKIGGKVLQASALACSTESFFLQPRSGQDFWPTAYALPPKASTQF